MSSSLDIQKLAMATLASVEEDERTKTASDCVENEELTTEIGKQLKSAAELLRGASLNEVTYADLTKLTKSAGLVGGTVGGVSGSATGTGDSVADAFAGASQKGAGVQQATTQAPMSATASPKLGSSKLGHELRSLAHKVRLSGQQAEESRLVKAAHMFNAGVALAHLIGEAQ